MGWGARDKSNPCQNNKDGLDINQDMLNLNLIFMRRKNDSILKRIFDIILSGVGLLVSFPVWILSSISIIMENGGPILIWQNRVGKDGNMFRVLKFRTMDKNAHLESPVNHSGSRNDHITYVGRLMRATAMDELPQLLSIFLGDMSFVGPRPIHSKEAEISGSIYDCLEDVPDFDLRVSMKPGLTGIAQIYAKKDMKIEEKIKYDLLYLEKQSFFFDIKLIFLSFLVTFRGKWESRDKKL